MKSFLLLVLCGLVLGSDLSSNLFRDPAHQVLELHGEVPDPEAAARACTGSRANEPGCNPPLLEGPSTLIWHADGTCSRLVLNCLFDGIAVHLESPGSTTEVYLGWQSDPVPNPGRPLAGDCTQAQVYPRTLNNHTTVSKQATHHPTNVCGSQVVTSPEGKTTVSNNLHILELLDLEGFANPRLQIISHTHVHLQCCHSSRTQSSACVIDDPESGGNEFHTAGVLVKCTAKDFVLACHVDEATQQYKCSLGLAPGATLGDPRVKYVLDGCDAASSSAETVELITAGPVGNVDLEVQLTAENAGNEDNADLATYHFQSPYLQFNSADEFAPADVSISCRVSVVPKVLA